MSEEVEDVSDYYEGYFYGVKAKVAAAERKGRNVLVLMDHGLEGGAKLAGDKTGRRWEVIYYWLTREDAELCEVQGSEVTWWKSSELNPAKPLFGQINLF